MTTEESGAARAFGAVLDGAATIAMAIASTLMTVLIVIFSWLVFGRYVLNATPTWVEQVSLLIVVWITFLGAAVGIRRKTHLAVDFIREGLPRPIRNTLAYFAVIALCAFGIVMAWQGWVMLERTMQREIPMLGVSEGWRSVPVIVSGVMIALFTFDDLRRAIFHRKAL
ncbi:MAG: TRAP transporter small permease [Pseudomonadota bacterium]